MLLSYQGWSPFIPRPVYHFDTGSFCWTHDEGKKEIQQGQGCQLDKTLTFL